MWGLFVGFVLSDGKKEEEEEDGWLLAALDSGVVSVPSVLWLVLMASVTGTGLLSVDVAGPSVVGGLWAEVVEAAGLSRVPVA